MGKLEKRVQDRMRRTKINKAIIGTVALTGVLAVGLLAPNVLGILGKAKLLPQQRYRIKNTLSRMIKNGYVRMEEKEGQNYIRLTEKGERFSLLMQDGEVMPVKPKKWDKKWRIITYDFHGKAMTLRTRIRELLRAWGFVMLHQSMWVYPYDCEDLVFILKQEFKLGKGLLYIIADEIENDASLKARFKLR